MVLDITFCNTFSHKFLSEKDPFLGHSCVEGGGSCCRGGFFQVLFPVTCPEHLYVLLLGCLDTRGEDWKNLATYFQLWNRVRKGTLSPLLAVLHSAGFSFSFLTQAPCPHGETGNTWLWTSCVWCLYWDEHLSDLEFPLTSLFQTSRFQISFLRLETKRDTHQRQWENLLFVCASAGFLPNIKTGTLLKKGPCVNLKNTGVNMKL